MNKSTLLAIIAFALLLFLAVRGVAHLVCEPNQHNPVVEVVSNAISPSEPLSASTKPDPLSWEPVLRSIISLASKACPK